MQDVNTNSAGDVVAENFLPKRQSKPDGSQFYGVVFHWVVEAFHKSQPDLVKKKKKRNTFHFLNSI